MNKTIFRALLWRWFSFIVIPAALFLLPGITSGQQIDSSELGLKVVSFEVQENNYTGLDDGSENKLRNAMIYLRDKLTPVQQEKFSGYELGLYRVSGRDKEATNALVENYVEEVENIGNKNGPESEDDYYLLPVKIWSKDNQTIDEFRFYYNLPADLPAYEEFTKEELQAKAVEFIVEEFNIRGKNIERVKQAVAEGIRRWADFIYEAVTEEILSSEEFILSTTLETDEWTFLVPTGELIALGGTYNNKRFVGCDHNWAPQGSLAVFVEGGVKYYGWYLSRSGRFKGYAPADPDKLPEKVPLKPYTNYTFTLPIDKENVHGGVIVKDETSNVVRLMARKGSFTKPAIPYTPTNDYTGKAFNRNPPIAFNETVIGYSSLALQKNCFTITGTPNIRLEKTYSDLKTNSTPNNITPPDVSFTTGCTFVDYTGLYTHFGTALINDKFVNNKVDIIISDDNSLNNTNGADKLSQLNTTLSNTDALQRAVLWVHIGSDGKPRREVIYPTGPGNEKKYYKELTDKLIEVAEQNSFTKNGNGSGKQPSEIESGVNPDTGVTVGESETNSLLNFFGFSQLMFASVSEFLEGVKLDEPKYWDGNAPDYFLKDAPFVLMLKTTGFDKLISFGCGAFTGAVDAVASFKDDLAAKKEIIDFIFDSKARSEALGKISETFDLLTKSENAKMRAFIFATLKAELSSEINEVLTNPYKPWYYAGYFPANLAMESALGSGISKLKAAIGATTAIRSATKVAENMIRKVKSPKLENLLGRMIRKEGIDEILEPTTGNSWWHLKKDGQLIAEIDEEGFIKQAGTNLPGGVTIIEEGTSFPVKGSSSGAKARIVKTRNTDPPHEEKWAVVAFDKDGLITKILNRFELGEQYRKDIEKFVNANPSNPKYSPESILEEPVQNATKFMKGLTSSSGEPLVLDFLKDLQDLTPNSIGTLLAPNGGLTDDLITVWHHAYKSTSRKEDRLSTFFLKNAEGFRKYQKTRPGQEKRIKLENDPKYDFQVQTPDGIVKYDKNGFPDFYPDFSPSMPGVDPKDFCVQIEDLRGYLPPKTSGLDENRVKDPGDFTKAKNALLKQLSEKYPNQNIEILFNGSNFDLDGKTYIWHHHEDGRTMVPVLKRAHEIATHAGGASVLKNELKGLYQGPF